MRGEDKFTTIAYAIVGIVIMAFYIAFAWLDPEHGPISPTGWGVIAASFFAGVCSGMVFAHTRFFRGDK